MTAVKKITVEDYLASEPDSEFKREFVNGEIIAMAGASHRHNQIASNLLGTLFVALRGSPCSSFGSDYRIHVLETGLFAYPDALILCGKPELLPKVRPDTLTNPSAVFEILSDSTETWDRGAKASHYRRMHSLREYTFIAQTESRIEHYVRQADDHWLLQDDLVGWDGGDVHLSCVNAQIPLREIYRSVEGADPAVPNTEG